MKNFPGRFAAQATACVLLTWEQISLRIHRQPSRLDPAGDGFSRVGMKHNRGSRPLTLRRPAGDVESRNGTLVIPDLPDLKRQEFTDPEAGVDIL